jgi:tetratricopeptide (TPR) repeat protein
MYGQSYYEQTYSDIFDPEGDITLVIAKNMKAADKAFEKNDWITASFCYDTVSYAMWSINHVSESTDKEIIKNYKNITGISKKNFEKRFKDCLSKAFDYYGSEGDFKILYDFNNKLISGRERHEFIKEKLLSMYLELGDSFSNINRFYILSILMKHYDISYYSEYMEPYKDDFYTLLDIGYFDNKADLANSSYEPILEDDYLQDSKDTINQAKTGEFLYKHGYYKTALTIYKTLNNFNGKIDCYKNLISIPDTEEFSFWIEKPDYLKELAQLYQDSSMLDSAFVYYRMDCSKNPDSESCLKLAILSNSLKNYTEAISYFLHVGNVEQAALVELVHNVSLSNEKWIDIADSCMDLEEYGAAAYSYLKAKAEESAAQAFFMDSSYENAAILFENVYLKHNRTSDLMKLAQSYEMLGQKEKARDAFNKVLVSAKKYSDYETVLYCYSKLDSSSLSESFMMNEIQSLIEKNEFFEAQYALITAVLNSDENYSDGFMDTCLVLRDKINKELDKLPEITASEGANYYSPQTSESSKCEFANSVIYLIITNTTSDTLVSASIKVKNFMETYNIINCNTVGIENNNSTGSMADNAEPGFIQYLPLEFYSANQDNTLADIISSGNNNGVSSYVASNTLASKRTAYVLPGETVVAKATPSNLIPYKSFSHYLCRTKFSGTTR